jgi:3-hydroxyisobutyrate dehydrogenase-like beta-hydroxyacid dehydrogenase
MPERVAVIGLGNMGLPIARNLLRAGVSLTVHNRTKTKGEPLVAEGAAWADSPAAAAERARVVITMVSDDSALDEVVFGERGLVAVLGDGAIHLAMSTIEPATARRLADAHVRHGARYVAAPVFGRPEMAEQAKLWVIAAGPSDAVQACVPVLEVLSRGISRVGEDPSRANLVKLAGNFLLLGMLEALGEVFTLVEKAGMDRLEVLETLNGALFASAVYQSNGERMCRGAFRPAGFPLALALKDARLVLRAADQLGVPMPLANLAHDHMLTGVARGQGHLDWTAVAEVLRDAAGLGGPTRSAGRPGGISA